MSTSKGYSSENTNPGSPGLRGSGSPGEAKIYICDHCTMPTIFWDVGGGREFQCPGPKFGLEVEGVPDEEGLELNTLYKEARACMTAGAYTAAVKCCRTLLAAVAVDKNAKNEKYTPFTYYVDYLKEKNLIPPNTEECLTHIRNTANETIHEFRIMEKDEAVEIMELIEMLLTHNYAYAERTTRAMDANARRASQESE